MSPTWFGLQQKQIHITNHWVAVWDHFVDVDKMILIPTKEIQYT